MSKTNLTDEDIMNIVKLSAIRKYNKDMQNDIVIRMSENSIKWYAKNLAPAVGSKIVYEELMNIKNNQKQDDTNNKATYTELEDIDIINICQLVPSGEFPLNEEQIKNWNKNIMARMSEKAQNWYIQNIIPNEYQAYITDIFHKAKITKKN